MALGEEGLEGPGNADTVVAGNKYSEPISRSSQELFINFKFFIEEFNTRRIKLSQAKGMNQWQS